MKTEEQVEHAIEKLTSRLNTPGLTYIQMAALSGMMTALCWAIDFEFEDGEPNNVDVMLSDIEITPGVQRSDMLDYLQKRANQGNN